MRRVRSVTAVGTLGLILSSATPASPSLRQADDRGPEIVGFVTDRTGDRDVFSMGSGGEHATNLSEHPRRDQAPALSPDRRQIAWMSDRSGHLAVWLMRSDGSVPRLLRELPEADFGLAWAPAGDRLAVTLRRDGDGSHDLGLVEIASGQLTRLTDTPGIEEITPTWSPDGEALLYVAGSGASTALMRLHLKSGVHEALVADLPSVSFPAVSPDGATILLRSRTDQFDILQVDLATGQVANLTNHPANDWGATWSRDGRSIAFASDRDGDMEIYTLDLASGEIQQLTDNEDRDWMPTR